jgi:hypothetical protein
MKKLVQVFNVVYDKKEQILKTVKNTIDRIEEAKEREDLLLLPACKGYMNDKGKCPIMKECHSGDKSGCVPDEIVKKR